MPSRVWQLATLQLLCVLLFGSIAEAQTNTDVYVTRAEAASFLLRNREPPIPDIRNDGKYPDVLDDEWYTKYVMAALEMGMWKPDQFSGRALQHQPVQRGEYLTMMAMRFDMRTGGPYAYRDIYKGHTYEGVAGIAARYKLFLDPRDPLRLRPDVPVTHEEASKAYYTLLANANIDDSHSFVLHQRIQDPEQAEDDPAQHDTMDVLQTYTTILSRGLVKSSLQKKLKENVSTAERIQAEVIAATNAERIKAGIAPLQINKFLQSSAVQHAKDMHDRAYFSHFTPEGKSYVERIKESGYTDVDPVACGCSQIFTLNQTATEETREVGPNFVTYEADVCSCRPKYALGENLAKGQLTVEEVVRDWMNSPGHRRNILEPSFTELGVGIFRDLWVQNFGKFDITY